MCFLLKHWSIVDLSESGFDKVFTGHFHCAQQVGSNIWYPGSLIPFKFDEGDVDHGFIVLDTETLDHEFVSIWAGETQADRPPQFLTLDDDGISAKTEDEVRGNVVRVALSHEYTSNQLEDIRKHLQELGAKTVRWLHIGSKDDKQKFEIAADQAATASELFTRFAAADKNAKPLKMELLLKLNREVVSEGDRRYTAAEDIE
jgi:hypothetical protein